MTGSVTIVSQQLLLQVEAVLLVFNTRSYSWLQALVQGSHLGMEAMKLSHCRGGSADGLAEEFS